MSTGQLFMMCLAACVALLFVVWGLFEWAARARSEAYRRAVQANRQAIREEERARDAQLRADLERRFAEDWRAGRLIIDAGQIVVGDVDVEAVRRAGS